MRRFVFFILLGVLFWVKVPAQELRSQPADFCDYISLLNASGYIVYSFDISSLKDQTYYISFDIREYSKGEQIVGKRDRMTFAISNRDMIEDFSEETQKRLLSEGTAYDLDKGIYSLSERISIGFCPTVDTLRKVTLSVVNMGGMEKNLSLKTLTAPGYEPQCLYDIRPFKSETIQVGGFTPLLLLGSYWYDEQRKVVRFCGEKEFSADMSSPTLKLIPHYYVIGIKVMKK